MTVEASIHKILLLSAVLVFALENAVLVAEEPRLHRDGPLTADEFRQKPPAQMMKNGVRISAFTTTDTRYTYSYNYETEDGKTTAKVTRLHVEARFVPEKSWNARKGNAALLDHEQGHFDIAEIYSLKMQIELAMARNAGQPLQVIADSPSVAVKQLDKHLKKYFDDSAADAKEANLRYDRATEHGLNVRMQAAHRLQQKKQLARLQKLLADTLKK